MDEELHPDAEDVNSVLAQESSELYRILSNQSPTVIMKLCQMMPSGNYLATERIETMLEYFTVASAAHCRSFLQSICMLCEDIPMHLESRLMSVAGYAATDAIQPSDTQPVSLENTDGCENFICSLVHDKSSPSEQQLIKRPRIDHWERYIAAVTHLLNRKWERLSEHLVSKVHLENVWVSLRLANRGRDRPDQTPGSADKGSRTPEPDGDFGLLESRVMLESFLQGCAGKVTVVVGRAGSGKTLLMSCLGQQWAQGLGPIPSSYLFVLLEFRQLNLLSRPLSLSELLFRHYLSPKEGDGEKRAIVDYLISNPEQSCWVLDGYDEFHSKLTRDEVQRDLLDAETPLSVVELISGLLNRQLLPGCTVLVTCRLRDVKDLEGISDKVGQLLEWDQHEIKEYVDNFFGVKGNSSNRPVGMQAADLLLSNQHLLAMSSLPALCNICCMCIKHLLLETKEGARSGDIEEETRRKTTEKGLKGGQAAGERRRGSKDIMMDGTNGRAQLPPTLTQVYLNVLRMFLSYDPDKGGEIEKAKATRIQQSLDSVTQYQSEMCELTQLAWSGLEESKILFMKEEISLEVLELSVRKGLFTQVEINSEDGALVSAYCFVHLTIQEFLAALRIMTSNDVSDVQLKKRFSLKTRWTTKSDQRTVFTDSLHLYVCGLASSHCTPALVQLARGSGITGAQSWVEKRQALVLKLLKKLCHSNTLTGPKILELCCCVQESQDHQLAKDFVATRPTLELRNIRLLPNDIDALAYVVNSVGDTGIGLDFGACSMDMDCLDVLPRCQYVHNLSFRSRKYGDRFAEKLSNILPEFSTLRKLEFCGASLTAAGAASLASALRTCLLITEINLSDNNLQDDGIEHIADTFTKLPRLVSVMLGRNNSSLKAVDCLIGKMSSCLNMQRVHADGTKELTVMFSQNSDINSQVSTKSQPTISLLNQKWTTSEMQKLATSLACCPALSVLDLSGGQWDVEILRTLTQLLPKFSVTKKITLNDSCSSVDGLVLLTALLSDCPAVVELNVRLKSSPDPNQVYLLFPGGIEKTAKEVSKTLCLSCCNLQPADLNRVWRSLGTSCDLTIMDLSSNSLGNKGLKKLLDVLPHLRNIQEINASNNDITMEGVLILAEALCSHNNLTQIHIRDGGREQMLLKFCPDKSFDKQQLKVFRINNSSLLPPYMTRLCTRLAQCHSCLELDLSHSSLKDQAFKNLMKVLPKMESLQTLNVGHSITSTTGALMLVSGLTISQRVESVELRLDSESFIHFDSVKAEQTSCRLTHFSLNSDNLERLLEILQQVPQLSELNLSGNQINDEGVNHFVASLPRLNITNYVNLSNNNLTQDGLLDVANTLCTCDTVSAVEVSLGEEESCLIWFRQHRGYGKTLSVRESSLKQEHLDRLADIVSDCPSLTKLVLKGNSLQSEWVEDFVKQFRGQRKCSLSIEECWVRAEEAVHLVCRCLDLNKYIKTIRIHHNTLQLSLLGEETSVSTDSADPTSSVATEQIGLVDCAVQGYQLAAMRSIIQRCTLLTELDLSHNSLGIEGAEFLCSVLPLIPNLVSLSIVTKEKCPDVLEKLSETLLQSTSIQSLNLSGHVIGETVSQALMKILPRLRSLNLSHCEWSATVWLQIIQVLGQCGTLQGLWLNNIPTVTGPSEVSLLLNLLPAMEGLTQMAELELEGWRMAERGVEQLTRLLPIWTDLRKISLSENLINDQSGDRLMEALISCRHLEELHLSRNSLGDLTAEKMARVLPSLTHITVLDISENCIGSEGSASLSKAIICMKNLTRINLTSVGTSELCAVAASLAHCPLIQDVGLGWNNCGDTVALELSKVLPLCQELTRIDLESNSVSVVGVEALVKALQSCPALQLIRLWRNKVSSIEAQRFSNKDKRLNFSFS